MELTNIFTYSGDAGSSFTVLVFCIDNVALSQKYPLSDGLDDHLLTQWNSFVKLTLM